MTDINKRLGTLYDILITNFDDFENELKELILRPRQIENTNKFTWLISEFVNKPSFIDPFLLTISEGEKGDRWLVDYLFAASNLIEKTSSDEVLEIPDGLMNKLRLWILESKGELSWHAAYLLKYFKTTTSEEIQLKKLEERGDFHLAYVECLQGLLWFDRKKYIELVREVSTDTTRDENLREYAISVCKNYR